MEHDVKDCMCYDVPSRCSTLFYIRKSFITITTQLIFVFENKFASSDKKTRTPLDHRIHFGISIWTLNTYFALHHYIMAVWYVFLLGNLVYRIIHLIHYKSDTYSSWIKGYYTFSAKTKSLHRVETLVFTKF